MTFMSKQCTWHQCSNNTNRWMTFVFIPHKPMKNIFRTTIIVKLWPMKFVMNATFFKMGNTHNINLVSYNNIYNGLVSPSSCGGFWMSTPIGERVSLSMCQHGMGRRRALEAFFSKFCAHFISKGCQWCYNMRMQSLFWDVLLQ